MDDPDQSDPNSTVSIEVIANQNQYRIFGKKRK